MKERPILFSAPMIVALLANRKSQTRRTVARGNSTVDGCSCPKSMWAELDFATATAQDKTTIGQFIHGDEVHLRVERRGEDTFHRVRSRIEVGDRLWVRENFRYTKGDPIIVEGVAVASSDGETEYAADGGCGPWKPSIHMPRVLCRLVLEATRVRIQRLQDISEEDCIAEGMDGRYVRSIAGVMTRVGEHDRRPPFFQYASLWDSINGPGAWNLNPWVWAITFTIFPPDTAPPAPAP